MGRHPGGRSSRTTDIINQSEGAVEATTAAAAAVAAAAYFHLVLRHPLNRTLPVNDATHFLPATIPTAMRLRLSTAGVSRIGRLHLTSGMRSRANLRTTRGAATVTGARAALKEGTTVVISTETGNFIQQEASRGGGDYY